MLTRLLRKAVRVWDISSFIRLSGKARRGSGRQLHFEVYTLFVLTVAVVHSWD